MAGEKTWLDDLKNITPSGSQISGFFSGETGKNISEILGYVGMGFVLTQLSGGSGVGNLVMAGLLYVVDKFFLDGALSKMLSEGLKKATDALGSHSGATPEAPSH